MHDILLMTGGGLKEGAGHIVRSAALSDLLVESGSRMRVLCDSTPALLKLFSTQHPVPINAHSGGQIETVLPKTDILVTDLPPERDRTHISDYARINGVFHVGINDLMLANGSFDICINPSVVSGPCDMEKSFQGPQFAILNRRITDQFTQEAALKESVENVFISMGGTDPGGLAERIITGLLCDLPRNIRIFVVSARISPKITGLQKRSGSLCVINNPENIGELLRSSDIAIVSAGITLYECCFAGVPAIVIPQNRFQEQTAEEFQRRGAAVLLKSGNISGSNSVAAVFEKLAGDFNMRKRISGNGQAIVDGKGGERVVNLILDSFRGYR